MAGMPPALIDRANEILTQLEKSRDDNGNMHKGDMKESMKNLNNPKMQLSIFDAHSITFDAIRSLLENTDINRLTPVEALLKLQEIKSKLN
jgi:DNA mismatch repair protein MutS